MVPGVSVSWTLNMKLFIINLQDTQYLISALQTLKWVESTRHQHSKIKLMAICSFSMSNLFLSSKARCLLYLSDSRRKFNISFMVKLAEKKTTPKHWIYILHTYQWSQNANRDSMNYSKGARACVRLLLCTRTPVWFGEVTQLSPSHGEAVWLRFTTAWKNPEFSFNWEIQRKVNK